MHQLRFRHGANSDFAKARESLGGLGGASVSLEGCQVPPRPRLTPAATPDHPCLLVQNRDRTRLDIIRFGNGLPGARGRRPGVLGERSGGGYGTEGGTGGPDGSRRQQPTPAGPPMVSDAESRQENRLDIIRFVNGRVPRGAGAASAAYRTLMSAHLLTHVLAKPVSVLVSVT